MGRPINLVWEKHPASMSEITSMQVLHQLRPAPARLYGKDQLGFPQNKLGTPSLRLKATTAAIVQSRHASGNNKADHQLERRLLLSCATSKHTRGVATEMTMNPEIMVMVGQT